jgi:V/A-type H+-transporting ATPase subunit K
MNTALFIGLPIAFLIASVAYAIHAVKKGTSRKKAVITQVISFAAVCLISFAIPMTASAADTNGSSQPATASTSATAADPSKGMEMLAIAIADGIASIGGAVAVATSAPAAIGATGEDPKVFGKALIFVALGEGIAIYGLLLGILMLQKV